LKKLAIIVTHPIQYYVPLFQLLAKNCKLKVFYTWGADSAQDKYDPDFKQWINWDLPLLEGYNYEFLANTSKNPGSHHFSGIINPNLKQKIKEFDPMAILIYGWAYQSHISALRYFKGKIPLWFRGDSTLIDEQKGIKEILRSLFLKWIYQHSNKAFYVGCANKAYFKKFGLQESQLVFAPHAVDNDRFAEDRSKEALQLRQQLQILPDQILILFAGKLEAKKNPQLLLKAFINLNLYGAHLLFVGNGELEEGLKTEKILQQAQDDKVSKIHFMDFQNQTQMPIIYQACDLFCLPSQGSGETWGLAVNEAMACGKAILVSDHVGCAKDLVIDGENGYIFESNNLASLSDKLNLMVSNKFTLKEMGKKSAIKIKEWSFTKQCTAILNELENK
jgi:glycosyltransferase involved in cell wall biosynthesis